MQRCIVLGGPTCVGKTALAYRLAAAYGLPVISADARQCFRELNIGVAKPSAEMLRRVPHYFINSHCIAEEMSAAVFSAYVRTILPTLFRKYNQVLIVGGGGLYLEALLYGLTPIPSVPPEVRAEVQRLYETQGIAVIRALLEREDPLSAQGEARYNPHRMLRALMVKRATGISVQQWRRQAREKEMPHRMFVLEKPRNVLYRDIEARVAEMAAAGLETEARALYAQRHLPALQTIGYQEFFAYFEKKITYEACIARIKQQTRRYAKRQITFFKRFSQAQVLKNETLSAAFDYLCAYL